jgi:ABC-type sulfate transport system permease component
MSSSPPNLNAALALSAVLVAISGALLLSVKLVGGRVAPGLLAP